MSLPARTNRIDEFIAQVDRAMSRQFGNCPLPRLAEVVTMPSPEKTFRVGYAEYQLCAFIEKYDCTAAEIADLESLAIGEQMESGFGYDELVTVTRVS